MSWCCHGTGDARTRRRLRGKIEETYRNDCDAITSDAILAVFSESKKCLLSFSCWSGRFQRDSFSSGCAVRFSSFFCICGWIGGWELWVAGATSVSDTAQGRVLSTTTTGNSPGFPEYLGHRLSTAGVLLKGPSFFSFVGGWVAGNCGLVLSQILTTKYVPGVFEVQEEFAEKIDPQTRKIFRTFAAWQ